MKCRQCGSQLPVNATSCRECGASLVATSQGPSKKPLIYGIVALAIIAIVALVIAVFAMRGKPMTVAVSPDATNAKPVTTATTPAPPLSAPITQGNAPQVQVTPGAKKQECPPEVLEYLEYVKQIEQRRQALLRDQGNALAMASAGQADSLGQLFDMAMDPEGDQEMPDPFKPVREELSRQVANWQVLIRQFDAKQPVPQQCAQFAGAYRYALAAETYGIYKINVIMNDVSEASKQSMTEAISQLQRMRKDPQLQGNIDKATEVADTSLATLCKQYEIEKPFDVPKEQGGASLIGF